MRFGRMAVGGALSLALAACQGMPTGAGAGSAAGVVVAPLSEAERALFAKPRVHGRASAEGPLADAEVRVFDTAGQEIQPLPGETRRTNAKGMFSLRFEALPATYRIVVTGGSVAGRANALTLATRVQPETKDRQSVNLATSLVDGLMQQRPELTRGVAEADVKAYLGIPRGLDLGYSIEGKPQHFDAAAAVAEAQALGGTSAYVARHVGDLVSGKQHPQAVVGRGAAYRLQQAEVLMPLASWAAKTLVTGAVSYLGGLGMGSVLKRFGLTPNDPNAAAFAKVNQELASIKHDIDQLRSEVDSVHDDLARRVEMGNYNNNHNVGTMTDLITFNQHILDLEQDLMSYADTQATDIAQTKHDIREYSRSRLEDALNQWHTALVGSGANDDGAIAAWNRRVTSAKGRFVTADMRQQIQSWWEHVDAQRTLTLIFIVQSRQDQDREVMTTLKRWSELRQTELQALRGTLAGSDTLDLRAGQADVPASTGVAPDSLGVVTTALRRFPDGVVGDTTLGLLWRPEVEHQISGRHGVYGSPRDISDGSYTGPLRIAVTSATTRTGIGGWRAATEAEMRSLLQSSGGNIARLKGVGFNLPNNATFFAAVVPSALKALYFNVDAGTTGEDNLSSTSVGRPFWMVRSLSEAERYWY